MIIDGLCYLGQSLYGENQTPGQLLRSMKRAGIDKAVVTSFTPPDLDFKKANDRIHRVVSRQHKFIGFAAVDPRFGTRAAAEVKRCFKKLGLSGIKVNPLEQGFQANTDLIAPTIRMAGDLGIPVIIESGHPVLSNPLQIADLASRFPRTTILMAHGGQLLASGQSYSDALAAFEEHKNLYIETSAIVLTGKDGFLEYAAKAAGVSKICFGSSSPFGDPRVELERVRVAPLSDAQKEVILGSNLSKLIIE